MKRAVLAALTLFLPGVALAAPKTFTELACTVVSILDTATMTVILLGLVAYFYGIATNIGHFGEEKDHEKVKAYFFWGLIILFVMFSIWGIVAIVKNTLFDNGVGEGGQPINVCSSGGSGGTTRPGTIDQYGVQAI
ncbi:MAG: hypothetical protein HYS26_03895 [Candidatus Kaiserbacteria bacterium]|nr:MAG: hypothetical protein HYS26_03895 [Candidatus Kaiserbacteria bacterium]